MIYLALGGAAIALGARVDWAVHATAALLLTLLLCAIRNAWDLVTSMAPQGKGDGPERHRDAVGRNAVREKAQGLREDVDVAVE
jgi:hypothetical protein